VQITADMVPDAVGTWMFHCHVNDHIIAGMTALYRVR
jgi:manganese oxidase